MSSSFKCELCQKVMNTSHGLKIHKGKIYKNANIATTAAAVVQKKPELLPEIQRLRKSWLSEDS